MLCGEIPAKQRTPSVHECGPLFKVGGSAPEWEPLQKLDDSASCPTPSWSLQKDRPKPIGWKPLRELGLRHPDDRSFNSVELNEGTHADAGSRSLGETPEGSRTGCLCKSSTIRSASPTSEKGSLSTPSGSLPKDRQSRSAGSRIERSERPDLKGRLPSEAET